MSLLFLHGLGQTPESWESVMQALSVPAACPDLLAPLRTGAASYGRMYQAFAAGCARLPGPVHLCGLSLGGVMALQYGAEHPERVGSLVLIGAQYQMPRTLLRMQGLVFRLLPGSAFREMGLSKAAVLELTASMAELDFREEVGKIACPVLVLCSQKDRANRKAAQGLEREIPGAKLAWVAGAGHEVNRDAPEALAEELRGFYRRQGLSV